ncbi:DUF1009 domain-containing protein [Paracoccus sp. S-4012]|uniref:LpxI family protein n=1 Tax=Paracoccus sp. S-4012 TaxID=2665648 RepID=UPI0012AFAB3C|nr:UDP-2,3-diacylglucosamine diphosphatase LpxI [Paracoccus sp. S-4012]MRX50842.1 DUF1009 domain-containing protein [Paracoccus sp. S-4012]
MIAGTGRLPHELAAVLDDPLIAALDGFAPDGLAAESFRLERLVPFMDSLLDRGVERVVFAGLVRRPPLDPEAFDPRTAMLVPRIAMAMQQGDDATLREVIALFEEAGLAIAGVADLAPHLVPGAGMLAGRPGPGDDADLARAREIVAGLGHLDIGQGAVVARGLCLAVETLPGTEAMLDFVARTRPEGRGGVLWKAPKPGQDRRIDLPAVGPETVAQAAAARLAGIGWEAGGVVLIDRRATIAAAEAAGLFLAAVP